VSHPEKFSHDREGRTVTFRFTDIGLPPNEDPPEGEGYVVFAVKPEGSPDPGTEFRNNASIVFDSNPPIETGEVVHVIRADSGNTFPIGTPLLIAGVITVVLVVAGGAILKRRQGGIPTR